MRLQDAILQSEMPPNPVERAADIARAVQAAGGRALVVGGWVRDHLLGRDSKDLDLEVYGLPADRLFGVLESFGRVETVGESFQVYKLGDIDVSLPRLDSKSGRGHRGFEVRGDPALPPEAAARRRDFTVNAIAWNPLTGAFLDPFSGRADLQARILRAVDAATFGDDSLRVLRAVQFAARLEFAVEDATARLCRGIPLDDLPAERIWGEFEKLLFANTPSIGFAVAKHLNVLAKLFPELQALDGCPQDPEWHPEGDVWVHTLQVIDRARELVGDLPRPKQLAVLLGAVCHDFGKPATTAAIDGRIRSYFHEDEGVPPTITFLDRLNVRSIDGYDVRAQVIGLVGQHLKPMMWFKAREPVGDGAFRRLARKVDLELLARVVRADCHGRSPGRFDCSSVDWFLDRARALGVEHRPPAPLLLGRHVLALGLKPGPLVGRVLEAVYEKQLDGAVATLDQAIEAARELMKDRGGAL
jgi:tRNA nucleotidyltransferase (CCA-adding enzyme)